LLELISIGKKNMNVDANGLKTQRGVSQIFGKIPGGQGFQDKIARGTLILGFIAFLFKSFSNLPGGAVSSPLSPCVHLRT
jgi:hypothetical protein